MTSLDAAVPIRPPNIDSSESSDSYCPSPACRNEEGKNAREVESKGRESVDFVVVVPKDIADEVATRLSKVAAL